MTKDYVVSKNTQLKENPIKLFIGLKAYNYTFIQITQPYFITVDL